MTKLMMRLLSRRRRQQQFFRQQQQQQQTSWKRTLIISTSTTTAAAKTKPTKAGSSSSSSSISTVPILEVDDIDDQFHQYYYQKQIPVVLRNLAGNYPAISKWKDLNYLVETVAGSNVHCDVEASSRTSASTQQYGYGERMTIPFESYIDYLKLYEAEQYGSGDDQDNDNGPPLLYMAQNELQSFPGLMEDITIPSICTTPNVESEILGHVYHTMLWIGPKGCVSPLHHDPLDNLFLQLVGMKRIRLISKNINPNWLYAGGSSGTGDEDDVGQYNTSPVNIENPDLKKFPLYENVIKQQEDQEQEQSMMMDVELVPGDGTFFVDWKGVTQCVVLID